MAALTPLVMPEGNGGFAPPLSPLVLDDEESSQSEERYAAYEIAVHAVTRHEKSDDAFVQAHAAYFMRNSFQPLRAALRIQDGDEAPLSPLPRAGSVRGTPSKKGSAWWKTPKKVVKKFLRRGGSLKARQLVLESADELLRSADPSADGSAAAGGSQGSQSGGSQSQHSAPSVSSALLAVASAEELGAVCSAFRANSAETPRWRHWLWLIGAVESDPGAFRSQLRFLARVFRVIASSGAPPPASALATATAALRGLLATAGAGGGAGAGAGGGRVLSSAEEDALSALLDAALSAAAHGLRLLPTDPGSASAFARSACLLILHTRAVLSADGSVSVSVSGESMLESEALASHVARAAERRYDAAALASASDAPPVAAAAPPSALALAGQFEDAARALEVFSRLLEHPKGGSAPAEDSALLRPSGRVAADVVRDRARRDLLLLLQSAELPLDASFFKLVSAADALSRAARRLGAPGLDAGDHLAPFLAKWVRVAKASLMHASAALLEREPWRPAGQGGSSASLGQFFGQLGRAADRFAPAVSADPSAAAPLESALAKALLEHLRGVERVAASVLAAGAAADTTANVAADSAIVVPSERACVALNDLCAARSFLAGLTAKLAAMRANDASGPPVPPSEGVSDQMRACWSELERRFASLSARLAAAVVRGARTDLRNALAAAERGDCGGDGSGGKNGLPGSPEAVSAAVAPLIARWGAPIAALRAAGLDAKGAAKLTRDCWDAVAEALRDALLEDQENASGPNPSLGDVSVRIRSAEGALDMIDSFFGGGERLTAAVGGNKAAGAAGDSSRRLRKLIALFSRGAPGSAGGSGGAAGGGGSGGGLTLDSLLSISV